MSEVFHSSGMMPVFTEAIGSLAGILTTTAFAPQAIRTWRDGGEGLSWSMLTLFGTGVGLWFVYGILRNSGPVMMANGLTGLQVVFIFAVKVWRRRQRMANHPAGSTTTDTLTTCSPPPSATPFTGATSE